MTNGENQILEQLRSDFAEYWHVWRSTATDGTPGDWWATRRSRILTTDEMYGGLMHTLGEDTARELRAALNAQRHLEGLPEIPEPAGHVAAH